jgi:hypothetical protein
MASTQASTTTTVVMDGDEYDLNVLPSIAFESLDNGQQQTIGRLADVILQQLDADFGPSTSSSSSSSSHKVSSSVEGIRVRR